MTLNKACERIINLLKENENPQNDYEQGYYNALLEYRGLLFSIKNTVSNNVEFEDFKKFAEKYRKENEQRN